MTIIIPDSNLSMPSHTSPLLEYRRNGAIICHSILYSLEPAWQFFRWLHMNIFFDFAIKMCIFAAAFTMNWLQEEKSNNLLLRKTLVIIFTILKTSLRVRPIVAD